MGKNSFWAPSRLLLLGALFVALGAGCKSNSNGLGHNDGGVTDGATDRGDAKGGDTRPPDAGDAGKNPDAMCAAKTDGGGGNAALGETCACASDCASGFCADGVCCNAACTDSCMTCNLPSALGTCSPVPAGQPDSEATCKKESEATCGQDGLCDGKGGCEKYVAGTSCLAGKCDGDAVSGGYVCDGSGMCVLGPVMSCGGFMCDPGTNKCVSKCTSSAQCANGRQCVNGDCGARPLGYVCEMDSQCASKFCVDGVCCNTACNTPCLSCNQTGYAGHCRLLGMDQPDKDCPAQTPGSCGTTGRCDAFGSCAKWPSGTVCKGTACAGTTLNTAAVCDGAGTCGTMGVQECAPFMCTNGACGIKCTSDSECQAGHPCKQTTVGNMTIGLCGKKGPGLKCTDAAECDSGFCVDGVCCTSSCQGGCRQCNSADKPGTCTNIPAGKADPRNTCKDNGAKTCDTNGLCDGGGACQKYATGTECGPESCKNNAYTEPSKCNGSHQCVAGNSRTCAPNMCSGTKCATACTNDNQCVAPNSCNKNSCGLGPIGSDCSADNECGSGHCAQGVCCNSACTGACNACNLSGKVGTCTGVDNAADPQGICKATDAKTCGTTGRCKAGACAYWDNTNTCKDASCPTTSSAVGVSKCNGAGQCSTPGAVSCGSFVCSGGACKSTCTSNADCTGGNTCVNNSCGKKANGTSCAGGGECQSGNCTEGVCCDTACSDATSGTQGLCLSCKVSGKVGTCSPVSAGGNDLKNRCVKTDPVKGDCSNNGTCDGNGACAHYSTSTTCYAQSCSGGVQKNTTTCDKSGKCPAQTSTSCTPYACSLTSPSCLDTCTKDADCATGVVCNLQKNHCGDKGKNGEACKVGTDCTSGICTEGVCCDTTCTNGCSSCTAAKVGTCSPMMVGSTPRVAGMCPPAAPCGFTGTCDGAGACDFVDAGTACGATICTGGMQSPAPLCDGKGACKASATSTPCNAGYACDATMMTCNTSCKTTADCAANFTCVGATSTTPGTCTKKGNGDSCSADMQCSSGHCVGSVCCGTTCPVTAGDVCGNTGTCSASGACTVAPNTTSCRAASCDKTDKTKMILAATCTGGTCPDMMTKTCDAGYACVGTACVTMCTADTDCDTAGGYVCNTSSKKCMKMPSKKGLGEVCGGNAECMSNNCVDGVCCSTPTCGTCQACAAGTGKCANVAAGTVDTTGCPISNDACGQDGTCAAGGVCAVAPNTKSCRSAGCVAGMNKEIEPANCTGSGTCPTTMTTDCKTGYACVSGKCQTKCTAAGNECATGYDCDGSGNCVVAKADLGETCSANSDCSSNHCTDKVCCSVADCGTCQACGKGTGACAPVTAGTADDACKASTANPCSSGTCAAGGMCAPASTNTSCRAGSCKDGNTAILPASCNGTGTTCPAEMTQNCKTGYACVQGACKTECSGNGDCDTGYTCTDNACSKPQTATGGTSGAGGA